jgi:glycosyltransferase involved in cell wall biosynthesis
VSPAPRVLHVTQAAATGVIRHLEVLASTATGVEHHLVLPLPDHELGLGAVFDSAGVKAIRESGAGVHQIDMRRSPLHPSNVLAVRRLRRLIDDVDPDVVHAHCSIAGVTVRLAALGSDRVVAYTPHNLNASRRLLPRTVEKRLAGLTDVMIAVSESLRDEASILGLGARQGTVVIPNGLDVMSPPPAADPRVALGIEPGAPLVAMVSRLAEPKDPVMFARVCAEVAVLVPRAHFLMIGSGPLQEKLDRTVAALGLGARWHQLSDVPNASALASHIDVMVLCTASEGCPYSPLEAMRVATPVVLTDATGCRDLIEHGESGFLAPLGDDEAMARHVVALLTRPDLRDRIGEAGRRRVHSRYSRESMGRAYTDLYRRLAAARKPVTAAKDAAGSYPLATGVEGSDRNAGLTAPSATR